MSALCEAITRCEAAVAERRAVSYVQVIPVWNRDFHSLHCKSAVSEKLNWWKLKRLCNQFQRIYEIRPTHFKNKRTEHKATAGAMSLRRERYQTRGSFFHWVKGNSKYFSRHCKLFSKSPFWSAVRVAPSCFVLRNCQNQKKYVLTSICMHGGGDGIGRPTCSWSNFHLTFPGPPCTPDPKFHVCHCGVRVDWHFWLQLSLTFLSHTPRGLGLSILTFSKSNHHPRCCLNQMSSRAWALFVGKGAPMPNWVGQADRGHIREVAILEHIAECSWHRTIGASSGGQVFTTCIFLGSRFCLVCFRHWILPKVSKEWDRMYLNF